MKDLPEMAPPFLPASLWAAEPLPKVSFCAPVADFSPLTGFTSTSPAQDSDRWLDRNQQHRQLLIDTEALQCHVMNNGSLIGALQFSSHRQ